MPSNAIPAQCPRCRTSNIKPWAAFFPGMSGMTCMHCAYDWKWEDVAPAIAQVKRELEGLK